MTASHGIQLEFSDGQSALTTVSEIHAALAEVGAGVWPLDLRSTPDDVRQLLRRPTLTESDRSRLQEHFLLSRQRLLEIISATGREPNVLGGGELRTVVASHGYSYPQLWTVQGDADYTRFDRFHVNATADGIGVDEVLQVLSGRGVVIHLRQFERCILTLRLDCPSEHQGWLVTYNGGKPHIGSLSGAVRGTKVLVQAIGPARWDIQYEDEV